MKNRQVRHYGYEFKYTTNNVDPEEPLDDSIPELCKQLCDRLIADGHMIEQPDQLTVNRYEPGQGECRNMTTVYHTTSTTLKRMNSLHGYSCWCASYLVVMKLCSESHFQINLTNSSLVIQKINELLTKFNEILRDFQMHYVNVIEEWFYNQLRVGE